MRKKIEVIDNGPNIAPTFNLELCEHSAYMVKHAMKKRLEKTDQELSILRIAINRDLTDEERNQLPDTLQELERENLKEQINPWITLFIYYKSLVDDVTEGLEALETERNKRISERKKMRIASTILDVFKRKS